MGWSGKVIVRSEKNDGCKDVRTGRGGGGGGGDGLDG